MKRNKERGFNRKMKRLIGQCFERLESRYCLTVTAAVTGDNLVVSGGAGGAVVVHEDSAGTFSVTDNGVAVGTPLSNVTGGIKLNIDASAGADNDVTIDLAGQAVDKIMANLGDGNNSLTIQGGTVNGNVTFTGGADNDT